MPLPAAPPGRPDGPASALRWSLSDIVMGQPSEPPTVAPRYPVPTRAETDRRRPTAGVPAGGKPGPPRPWRSCRRPRGRETSGGHGDGRAVRRERSVVTGTVITAA